MAMFRLYAGLEENWGRFVKDILRKQYPDAKEEISKAMTDQGLGQKLLNIAMKQTQYDETRAQDAIQSQLMYWQSSQFDFTKGSPTWEDALSNMYSNLRHRAMSESMGTTKRRKRERSIDQAYGQRGEEGGAPEGGEGRMPTPEADGGVGAAEALGQALDDKAGIKQFVDLIDQKIGDLKAFLPEDERKLFELIFDDDVGSFGSDVNENMKQATALKDKHPELYERNQKRWSGFVGDLRKKLLEKIWEFVDDHLDPDERGVLRETFFADVNPAYVRRKEKEKGQGKLDYQQGIDERKLAKWKWMEQQGTLDDKTKASYESLKTNMRKRYPGIDLDAVQAVENPQAKGWEIQQVKPKRAAFSIEAVSFRVARAFSRSGT